MRETWGEWNPPQERPDHQPGDWYANEFLSDLRTATLNQIKADA